MTRKDKPQLRYTAIALLCTMHFFSSCSEPTNGSLESYIAKRDSLNQVKEQVELALMDVEKRIAELDTNEVGKAVTLHHVQKGTFQHFFEVYGSVQADMAATLYPESQGLVKQIAVVEGQMVRKGDVLMRLDAELLQSNIAELTTSLDLAKVLFEKQERLWDQNIGSEVQFLEAKNRKESLERSLATVQEQINKTTIRAPFEGVVDKIIPKVGEMASPQMPVMRLVNPKNMYITADVSEGYLGRVNEGDLVDVIVGRRDTIRTKVHRVGSYINPSNRSFEVRVNLEEGGHNILPNSLVVLKINDFTAEDAISIPSSLIMQDGTGDDYVFIAVAEDSNTMTARKQIVQAGMRYLGRTLIVEGVEHEQKLIDKGARSVRHGDAVKETSL